MSWFFKQKQSNEFFFFSLLNTSIYKIYTQNNNNNGARFLTSLKRITLKHFISSYLKFFEAINFDRVCLETKQITEYVMFENMSEISIITNFEKQMREEMYHKWVIGEIKSQLSSPSSSTSSSSLSISFLASFTA